MIENLLVSVGPPLAIGCAAMFFLWRRQRQTRDATSVDVGWTLILGGAGLYYAAIGDGDPVRRVVLAALVAAWAGRLASHLFPRAMRGEEDGRYRELRDRFGAGADRFFFWFYQAQALLAIVLSLPFFLIANHTAPLFSMTEWVAIALWLAAFAGETVADRQLLAFASDPSNRGRTCRRGLWRYSRHPNYFFEWMLWCAFALFAWSAPYGFIALASPAILLYLIVAVTGIPPTEAQAVKKRGDDYREYQRTTSAFIPWFPARNAP